jgi:hypothetical protein
MITSVMHTQRQWLWVVSAPESWSFCRRLTTMVPLTRAWGERTVMFAGVSQGAFEGAPEGGGAVGGDEGPRLGYKVGRAEGAWQFKGRTRRLLYRGVYDGYSRWSLDSPLMASRMGPPSVVATVGRRAGPLGRSRGPVKHHGLCG